MATERDRTTLHATAVALDGRGILILGASGSGKSALAVQLIGLGAGLVADDRTEVWRTQGYLMAACPPAIDGLIEARGIGVLRASPTGPVRLVHAVDLDQCETERLPPPRQIILLGCGLDLVLARAEAHFPFALMHLLRMGRAGGAPVDGAKGLGDGA